MDSFMVYLGAVICTLYGLRSVIAGIRNEKKSYWVSIGWDDTKKLLKDKYDKVILSEVKGLFAHLQCCPERSRRSIVCCVALFIVR